MINKTFPITEKLLSHILSAMQTMLDLLNRESENLVLRSDPHALSNIVSNKRELVSLLEDYTKQLDQILATEKLSANHQGIYQYLEKAQSAGINIGDTRSCWSSITALSKKCRSLNEQNSASIDLLSRHTQRAIQLLKGKSQQSATYGADGNTKSQVFSHTMISV